MKTLTGLTVVILVLSGCAATTTGEKSGAHTITYKVFGPTRKASITYTNGGTKTSQDTEAKVPWSKTIKSDGDAIVYQLNAQNSGPASKLIRCTISVDGKVVDRNAGRGQYAIADCQYDPSSK